MEEKASMPSVDLSNFVGAVGDVAAAILDNDSMDTINAIQSGAIKEVAAVTSEAPSLNVDSSIVGGVVEAATGFVGSLLATASAASNLGVLDTATSSSSARSLFAPSLAPSTPAALSYYNSASPSPTNSSSYSTLSSATNMTSVVSSKIYNSSSTMMQSSSVTFIASYTSTKLPGIQISLNTSRCLLTGC